MSHRIALLAALGAMCTVGLVAATAGAQVTHKQATRPAASGKTVVVKLHNYMFNPMTVTIKPGTTVKWEWLDGSHGIHNLTPLKKKGGLLFKGTGDRSSGSYSVKFTKKGTYYYECSIHPLSMQAKIIVS